MSAFFVTQRVRKVSGEHSGLTGTVGAIDPQDEFGQGLGVRFDGCGFGWNNGLPVRFAAGDLVWSYPHHFEPILPGGLESSEEITELFEPSPEVVHA